MAYSVAVYAGFLCVFVYAIGFVQRVGVPKDIDDGASASTAGAIAIDLALLGLEGRDLLREFGDDYDAYRRRVPMLVPGLELHATPATLDQHAGDCDGRGASTSR